MADSTKEATRLHAHYNGQQDWLKWGPYLSERQWGTVREDYSPDGNAWDYFPHDHARSRAYRWGEDGLAGICDAGCNLCFGVALWNGQDAIIKERLFGLTGPQGNHGEDVKELYYYLDSTPTHSYMKHLYKYPQQAFPYEELVAVNERRSKQEPEYELLHTGAFDEGRYFDVFTEYAKADPDDLLIKITVANRGPSAAPITVLPTIWFRNLWSFGVWDQKPVLTLEKSERHYGRLAIQHPVIGDYSFYFEASERVLITENETNAERLFGLENASPFVKDAINDAVVQQDFSIFENQKNGTKAAPYYNFELAAGTSAEIRLRICRDEQLQAPLGDDFVRVFQKRQDEADAFYSKLAPKTANPDLKNIFRQALAGMLWTKQYYHIDIPVWLEGDPGYPKPAKERKKGRNADWTSLNNEDIISMPDKWEYPWYAAWDLAFHCIPLAMVDVQFAKEQLILFLREWYMRPNGQIPAYEWAFSDVNPPVHAWACMEVYRIDKRREGKGDIEFLKRVFQKLLINFTWWVNRKDHNDNNIFEGGFLGLDNIGPFDRSSEIPGGGYLEQADGTSWMAMYCLNMLDMALEISQVDHTFEDVATKFFEHFIYIAASLNKMHEDWTGSWDEEQGFFFDILAMPNGDFIPIKIRSLVGLTTFFATLVLEKERLDQAPEFKKRMQWFRKYRLKNNFYAVVEELEEGRDILLSLIPRKRLVKMLKALLDNEEFYSPIGIRSLSKIHKDPYIVHIEGKDFEVRYEPGESTTYLFGGNSNWRGPVWMPMNYLLIQSLRELDAYYGKELLVECPSGSANLLTLGEVADELSKRLISIFTKDETGRRLVNGDESIYHEDPYFRDLVLFYEYFHADNGRGVGASHQTGWTGIVANLIDTCT